MKANDTACEMRRRDAAERHLLASLIVENPELGISLRAALNERKARDRAWKDKGHD